MDFAQPLHPESPFPKIRNDRVLSLLPLPPASTTDSDDLPTRLTSLSSSCFSPPCLSPPCFSPPCLSPPSPFPPSSSLQKTRVRFLSLFSRLPEKLVPSVFKGKSSAMRSRCGQSPKCGTNASEADDEVVRNLITRTENLRRKRMGRREEEGQLMERFGEIYSGDIRKSAATRKASPTMRHKLISNARKSITNVSNGFDHERKSHVRKSDTGERGDNSKSCIGSINPDKVCYSSSSRRSNKGEGSNQKESNYRALTKPIFFGVRHLNRPPPEAAPSSEDSPFLLPHPNVSRSSPPDASHSEDDLDLSVGSVAEPGLKTPLRDGLSKRKGWSLRARRENGNLSRKAIYPYYGTQHREDEDELQDEEAKGEVRNERRIEHGHRFQNSFIETVLRTPLLRNTSENGGCVKNVALGKGRNSKVSCGKALIPSPLLPASPPPPPPPSSSSTSTLPVPVPVVNETCHIVQKRVTIDLSRNVLHEYQDDCTSFSESSGCIDFQDYLQPYSLGKLDNDDDGYDSDSDSDDDSDCYEDSDEYNDDDECLERLSTFFRPSSGLFASGGTLWSKGGEEVGGQNKKASERVDGQRRKEGEKGKEEGQKEQKGEAGSAKETIINDNEDRYLYKAAHADGKFATAPFSSFPLLPRSSSLLSPSSSLPCIPSSSSSSPPLSISSALARSSSVTPLPLSEWINPYALRHSYWSTNASSSFPSSSVLSPSSYRIPPVLKPSFAQAHPPQSHILEGVSKHEDVNVHPQNSMKSFESQPAHSSPPESLLKSSLEWIHNMHRTNVIATAVPIGEGVIREGPDQSNGHDSHYDYDFARNGETDNENEMFRYSSIKEKDQEMGSSKGMKKKVRKTKSKGKQKANEVNIGTEDTNKHFASSELMLNSSNPFETSITTSSLPTHSRQENNWNVKNTSNLVKEPTNRFITISNDAAKKGKSSPSRDYVNPFTINGNVDGSLQQDKAHPLDTVNGNGLNGNIDSGFRKPSSERSKRLDRSLIRSENNESNSVSNHAVLNSDNAICNGAIDSNDEKNITNDFTNNSGDDDISNGTSNYNNSCHDLTAEKLSTNPCLVNEGTMASNNANDEYNRRISKREKRGKEALLFPPSSFLPPCYSPVACASYFKRHKRRCVIIAVLLGFLLVGSIVIPIILSHHKSGVISQSPSTLPPPSEEERGGLENKTQSVGSKNGSNLDDGSERGWRPIRTAMIDADSEEFEDIPFVNGFSKGISRLLLQGPWRRGGEKGGRGMGEDGEEDLEREGRPGDNPYAITHDEGEGNISSRANGSAKNGRTNAILTSGMDLSDLLSHQPSLPRAGVDPSFVHVNRDIQLEVNGQRFVVVGANCHDAVEAALATPGWFLTRTSADEGDYNYLYSNDSRSQSNDLFLGSDGYYSRLNGNYSRLNINDPPDAPPSQPMAIPLTGRQLVFRRLQEAKRRGVSVVRIWAHTSTVQFPFQVMPGVYWEGAMATLDWVLLTAGRMGLKVLLSAVDNWKYYNGVDQYVDWSFTAPTRLIAREADRLGDPMVHPQWTPLEAKTSSKQNQNPLLLSYTAHGSAASNNRSNTDGLPSEVRGEALTRGLLMRGVRKRSLGEVLTTTTENDKMNGDVHFGDNDGDNNSNNNDNVEIGDSVEFVTRLVSNDSAAVSIDASGNNTSMRNGTNKKTKGEDVDSTAATDEPYSSSKDLIWGYLDSESAGRLRDQFQSFCERTSEVTEALWRAWIVLSRTGGTTLENGGEAISKENLINSPYSYEFGGSPLLNSELFSDFILQMASRNLDQTLKVNNGTAPSSSSGDTDDGFLSLQSSPKSLDPLKSPKELLPSSSSGLTKDLIDLTPSAIWSELENVRSTLTALHPKSNPDWKLKEFIKNLFLRPRVLDPTSKYFNDGVGKFDHPIKDSFGSRNNDFNYGNNDLNDDNNDNNFGYVDETTVESQGADKSANLLQSFDDSSDLLVMASNDIEAAPKTAAAVVENPINLNNPSPVSTNPPATLDSANSSSDISSSDPIPANPTAINSARTQASKQLFVLNRDQAGHLASVIVDALAIVRETNHGSATLDGVKSHGNLSHSFSPLPPPSSPTAFRSTPPLQPWFLSGFLSAVRHRDAAISDPKALDDAEKLSKSLGTVRSLPLYPNQHLPFAWISVHPTSNGFSLHSLSVSNPNPSSSSSNPSSHSDSATSPTPPKSLLAPLSSTALACVSPNVAVDLLQRVAAEAAQEKLRYEAERHALFFNDVGARATYQQHLKTLVHRRNTFTGVSYKNDPTIFGWDLINEPRCEEWAVPDCGIRVQNWIREMSAFLRAQDPNHLIAIGSEGFFGSSTPELAAIFNPANWSGAAGQDFLANNALPDIDIATLHLWPDNWGGELAAVERGRNGGGDGGDGKEEGKDEKGKNKNNEERKKDGETLENGNSYDVKHINAYDTFVGRWLNSHLKAAAAAGLRKPILLEEFGRKVLTQQEQGGEEEEEWKRKDDGKNAENNNIGNEAKRNRKSQKLGSSSNQRNPTFRSTYQNIESIIRFGSPFKNETGDLDDKDTSLCLRLPTNPHNSHSTIIEESEFSDCRKTMDRRLTPTDSELIFPSDLSVQELSAKNDTERFNSEDIVKGLNAVARNLLGGSMFWKLDLPVFKNSIKDEYAIDINDDTLDVVFHHSQFVHQYCFLENANTKNASSPSINNELEIGFVAYQGDRSSLPQSDGSNMAFWISKYNLDRARHFNAFVRNLSVSSSAISNSFSAELNGIDDSTAISEIPSVTKNINLNLSNTAKRNDEITIRNDASHYSTRISALDIPSLSTSTRNVPHAAIDTSLAHSPITTVNQVNSMPSPSHSLTNRHMLAVDQTDMELKTRSPLVSRSATNFDNKCSKRCRRNSCIQSVCNDYNNRSIRSKSIIRHNSSSKEVENTAKNGSRKTMDLRIANLATSDQRSVRRQLMLSDSYEAPSEDFNRGSKRQCIKWSGAIEATGLTNGNYIPMVASTNGLQILDLVLHSDLKGDIDNMSMDSRLSFLNFDHDDYVEKVNNPISRNNFSGIENKISMNDTVHAITKKRNLQGMQVVYPLPPKYSPFLSPPSSFLKRNLDAAPSFPRRLFMQTSVHLVRAGVDTIITSDSQGKLMDGKEGNKNITNDGKSSIVNNGKNNMKDTGNIDMNINDDRKNNGQNITSNSSPYAKNSESNNYIKSPSTFQSFSALVTPETSTGLETQAVERLTTSPLSGTEAQGNASPHDVSSDASSSELRFIGNQDSQGNKETLSHASKTAGSVRIVHQGHESLIHVQNGKLSVETPLDPNYGTETNQPTNSSEIQTNDLSFDRPSGCFLPRGSLGLPTLRRWMRDVDSGSMISHADNDSGHRNIDDDGDDQTNHVVRLFLYPGSGLYAHADLERGLWPVGEERGEWGKESTRASEREDAGGSDGGKGRSSSGLNSNSNSNSDSNSNNNSNSINNDNNRSSNKNTNTNRNNISTTGSTKHNIVRVDNELNKISDETNKKRDIKMNTSTPSLSTLNSASLLHLFTLNAASSSAPLPPQNSNRRLLGKGGSNKASLAGPSQKLHDLIVEATSICAEAVNSTRNVLGMLLPSFLATDLNAYGEPIYNRLAFQPSRGAPPLRLSNPSAAPLARQPSPFISSYLNDLSAAEVFAPTWEVLSGSKTARQKRSMDSVIDEASFCDVAWFTRELRARIRKNGELGGENAINRNDDSNDNVSANGYYDNKNYSNLFSDACNGSSVVEQIVAQDVKGLVNSKGLASIQSLQNMSLSGSDHLQIIVLSFLPKIEMPSWRTKEDESLNPPKQDVNQRHFFEEHEEDFAKSYEDGMRWVLEFSSGKNVNDYYRISNNNIPSYISRRSNKTAPSMEVLSNHVLSILVLKEGSPFSFPPAWLHPPWVYAQKDLCEAD